MTDSDHTPSPTHCINCGAEVPDHAKFCHACGSAVYRPEDTSQPPESAAAEAPVPEAETNLIAEGLSPELSAKGGKGFTFFEAVGSGFSNYAVFSGRASRSEYWYWFLFTFIVGSVTPLIHPWFALMAGVMLLLPTWAVTTRRLHDVGRSGGWQLVALTGVGIIPFLYWMCKRGDVGENRYRRRPHAKLPAAEMDFADVIGSRTFWMIGLAVMLIGFVDQSVGQHMVMYLDRDVGLGPIVAANVLSAVFAISIVGKLGFGWFYDKLSVRGVMFCYFLMAVAVVLLFPVQILWVLVLFSIVRGLAHGGAIVDIPVLSKHCFGPKVLGKTIGILTACVTIGFALGPPIVGYLYDTQGNYRSAFFLLVGVSIAAGLALFGVKPTYRERVAAMEQVER